MIMKALVDDLVSSHSDHDSDNDGTIDEMVSSHSDQDSENKGSLKGVFSGAGTTYLSGAPEFTPGLVGFVLFLP